MDWETFRIWTIAEIQKYVFMGKQLQGSKYGQMWGFFKDVYLYSYLSLF